MVRGCYARQRFPCGEISPSCWTGGARLACSSSSGAERFIAGRRTEGTQEEVSLCPSLFFFLSPRSIFAVRNASGARSGECQAPGPGSVLRGRSPPVCHSGSSWQPAALRSHLTPDHVACVSVRETHRHGLDSLQQPPLYAPRDPRLPPPPPPPPHLTPFIATAAASDTCHAAFLHNA